MTRRASTDRNKVIQIFRRKGVLALDGMPFWAEVEKQKAPGGWHFINYTDTTVWLKMWVSWLHDLARLARCWPMEPKLAYAGGNTDRCRAWWSEVLPKKAADLWMKGNRKDIAWIKAGVGGAASAASAAPAESAGDDTNQAELAQELAGKGDYSLVISEEWRTSAKFAPR